MLGGQDLSLSETDGEALLNAHLPLVIVIRAQRGHAAAEMGKLHNAQEAYTTLT